MCNKIFNFLGLINLLETYHLCNFVVITDDSDLRRQIGYWAKNKNIKVINKIKNTRRLKRIMRLTPASIFFAFFRAIAFKFITLILIRFKPDKRYKYKVVMSLINHQSFLKNGGYKDAYSGNFPKYLKEKKIPFIILGEVLFPTFASILKQAVNNKEGFLIVSKDYFLSLKDITLSLFQALGRFIRPVEVLGSTEIDGVDL